MKLLKNRLTALETKITNNISPSPFEIIFGNEQEPKNENFMRFIETDASKPDEK